MATKDITDRQVVAAYEEAMKQRAASTGRDPFCPWPEDVLSVTTGQPYKVCYRAMERACDRGLVEYGVSLHAGWLTEKGKELLAAPLKALVPS
jgi:hypothetical protein